MYWHESGGTKYARRQCPASGSARQIFVKNVLACVWHRLTPDVWYWRCQTEFFQKCTGMCLAKFCRRLAPGTASTQVSIFLGLHLNGSIIKDSTCNNYLVR